MGFESRACTPEHSEANSIAERFMSVLVKIIHAAIKDKKYPHVEMRRRLMNCRNTPHPSTGKAPNELIMGRLLRIKIVTPIKTAIGKLHQDAILQEKESNKQRKQLIERNKQAIHRNIKIGDRVLIRQQNTTTKPPFYPKLYTIIKVKGTQVTAVRGTKTRVRNIAKCKILHIPPTHLIRQKQPD